MIGLWSIGMMAFEAGGSVVRGNWLETGMGFPALHMHRAEPSSAQRLTAPAFQPNHMTAYHLVIVSRVLGSFVKLPRPSFPKDCSGSEHHKEFSAQLRALSEIKEANHQIRLNCKGIYGANLMLLETGSMKNEYS